MKSMAVAKILNDWQFCRLKIKGFHGHCFFKRLFSTYRLLRRKVNPKKSKNQLKDLKKLWQLRAVSEAVEHQLLGVRALNNLNNMLWNLYMI